MNKQKPINLILLGDPAAGKATQAAHLVRKYGLYDLDMGKILRRPKNKKSGHYAKTAGKGILTRTRFVRNIFRKIIPKVKPAQGILFDGTPKMLGEAKMVRQLLAKNGRGKNIFFIYLAIPEAEMARRAVARRTGQGARRPDDSLFALKNRMRYYRTQIRAIKKFYGSHYPSVKISGLGTRTEVRRRLVNWIEARR